MLEVSVSILKLMEMEVFVSILKLMGGVCGQTEEGRIILESDGISKDVYYPKVMNSFC